MTESLFALNGRLALATGACIPVDGGYIASDSRDRG